MSKPKPTLPMSIAGKAPPAAAPVPAPRGPNRSTKASQKLKVLPDEPEPVPTQSKALKAEKAVGEEDDSDDDDDEPEEEEEEDVQVYKQLAQIPAGSARRDAMRLTRKEKARLPRVTAYCTATSYRLAGVFDHLKARQASHLTSPVKFDEVIYTPYSLPLPPSPSPTPSPGGGGHSSNGFGGSNSRGGSNLNPARHLVGKLVDIVEENNVAAETTADGTAVAGVDGGAGEVKPKKVRKPRFAIESEQLADDALSPFSNEHSLLGNGHAQPSGVKRTKAEVFIFDYGVCVIWGMTEEQERRFLSSLRKHEIERLATDDIEVEDLVYYYASYSRVFNDVIALKKGSSYMTKLSLSHALAQSVKLSFFEAAVGTTIDQTKGIPQDIIESGKIQMPRKEIMRQIGRLFLLRVNISLVGSMIDSPELFWTFPDLEPLYGAFKTYLEIPQRLNVITGRVDVLQDMLRLLKESVNSAHGEGLELIVVWLIVLEIVLGVITIMVDLFA